MSPSQMYIVLAIVALAASALVFFFIGRKKPRARFSKLAVLGLALIVAGIIFGESRLVGYSLIGAGVLLAVVDVVRKLKKLRNY